MLQNSIISNRSINNKQVEITTTEKGENGKPNIVVTQGLTLKNLFNGWGMSIQEKSSQFQKFIVNKCSRYGE